MKLLLIDKKTHFFLTEERNRLENDTKNNHKIILLGGKTRNDTPRDLRDDMVRKLKEEVVQYVNYFNTDNIKVMNKGNYFVKHNDSYSYSGITSQ